MSVEKIYPKGIMCFPKGDKAPEFVLGTVLITLNDLITFCKENPNLLTEYKGQKQLKLSLKNGNKGIYMEVDTFKPTSQNSAQQNSNKKASGR